MKFVHVLEAARAEDLKPLPWVSYNTRVEAGKVGTLQNFDEFCKALSCKVGQPLVPASGGCRTWQLAPASPTKRPRSLVSRTFCL